jgi:small subunit ribosomal protein S6
VEKENKIYETTFIINATLEDTQIDAVIEKVKELISKNGGEIRSTEKWGRRRLSYTIQKKNNGFYSHLEFKAPGDLVPKLERHYQLDEQIIRYLTVQLDKKALKAKELSAPVAPTTEPSVEHQEPVNIQGEKK